MNFNKIKNRNHSFFEHYLEGLNREKGIIMEQTIKIEKDNRGYLNFGNSFKLPEEKDVKLLIGNERYDSSTNKSGKIKSLTMYLKENEIYEGDKVKLTLREDNTIEVMKI